MKEALVLVGSLLAIGLVGQSVTSNKVSNAETFMASGRAISKNKIDYKAFEYIPKVKAGTEKAFKGLEDANWSAIHQATGNSTLHRQYLALEQVTSTGNTHWQYQFNQYSEVVSQYTRLVSDALIESFRSQKHLRAIYTAYGHLYTANEKLPSTTGYHRGMRPNELKGLKAYRNFVSALENYMAHIQVKAVGQNVVPPIPSGIDYHAHRLLNQIGYAAPSTWQEDTKRMNERTINNYLMAVMPNMNLHHALHYRHHVRGDVPTLTPTVQKNVIKALKSVPHLATQVANYSAFFEDNPEIKFIGHNYKSYRSDESYFTQYTGRKNTTFFKPFPESWRITRPQEDMIVESAMRDIIKTVEGAKTEASKWATMTAKAHEMTTSAHANAVEATLKDVLTDGEFDGHLNTSDHSLLYGRVNTNDQGPLNDKQKGRLLADIITRPTNFAQIFNPVVRFTKYWVQDDGGKLVIGSQEMAGRSGLSHDEAMESIKKMKIPDIVRENARRDIRMDNQKRELADNESITRLGQQIARIGVQGKRRKEKMDNNLAILDDLN